MPQTAKTSFWARSRHGPWPEPTLERLRSALDGVAAGLRVEPEVLAVLVFGSYARGDFSRKSDVDLLVLFPGRGQRERSPLATRVRRLVSTMETEHRLPMHLAPLLAGVEDRTVLTTELMHDIWRDGLVLYAQASSLVALRPEGLTPWALFRFSVRGTPSDRVRLSRKLHGLTKGTGIVRPPALALAPGALLVPVEQEEAVRAALDAVGATYDHISVWREA